MSAYIKGGIFCLVLISTGLYWFISRQDQLPVSRPPEQYSLIDKMEKVGVPEFALPRLDGSRFSFRDLAGKIVILNFWASWCNPCVEEFPSLMKLVEKFGGELTLVAVSADEDKKDMDAFLKAFGLPKPNIEILWDQEKKTSGLYGVAKIPESFLVGRDQKLIRKVVGIDDWYTEGSILYFADLLRDPK